MKSFKDAERVLRDAIKVLPENLLLNFIFADYLEHQKNLTVGLCWFDIKLI
jgi:hypothetical protein